jgi:23S rRNA pseudouridine955/2504/2580 synthase
MEFHVSVRDEGQKITKYLLKNSDGSKIFLFKLFRKGLIKVHGNKVDQTYILKNGDIISASHLKEPDADRKFRSVLQTFVVLFENDNLIAVDKNGDTEVYAGEKDYKNSLLEMVKSYLYRKNEPYSAVVPVHRIDRNTKGVVVFAKNEESAKKLNALFKISLVGKTYEALLTGKLTKPLFVEADIIRINETKPVQVKNVVVLEKPPEKSTWMKAKYPVSSTLSATIIRPIRYVENRNVTVTEISIWTGRHHQIRAVTQALGFPVVGDRKYFDGNKKSDFQNSRQELICKRITIEDLGLSFESRYSIALPN